MEGDGWGGFGGGDVGVVDEEVSLEGGVGRHCWIVVLWG